MSALALLVSLLVLTIRPQNGELALALTIGGCSAAAGIILLQAKPLIDFFSRLAENTGLPSELTEPLFKSVGMGILTQISSAVCQDAGQSAMAKLVELGGGVLCFVVSLPLMEAVLGLVESML